MSTSDFDTLMNKLGRSSQQAAPAPITLPSKIALLPPPENITLLTFNYFHNPDIEKQTWTRSRHSMNVQVFTETTPFTPHSSLATIEAAVQLHEVDFMSRYLDAKFPERAQDYGEFFRESDSMAEKHPDLLVGQVWMKSPGTRYFWGSVVRVWTDDFAEFNAEFVYEGHSFRDEGFRPPIKPNPDKKYPKLIGRYDPHGLWVSRAAAKKAQAKTAVAAPSKAP